MESNESSRFLLSRHGCSMVLGAPASQLLLVLGLENFFLESVMMTAGLEPRSKHLKHHLFHYLQTPRTRIKSCPKSQKKGSCDNSTHLQTPQNLFKNNSKTLSKTCKTHQNFPNKCQMSLFQAVIPVVSQHL